MDEYSYSSLAHTVWCCTEVRKYEYSQQAKGCQKLKEQDEHRQVEGFPDAVYGGNDVGWQTAASSKSHLPAHVTRRRGADHMMN